MISGFLALVALLPNTEALKGKFPDWFATPVICLMTYIIAAVVFVVVSLAVPDRPVPKGGDA